MAFEPVRIIHASHLRLDHQLEGLTHLPSELHRVVEDATLSAFDFLLAACIDHEVDFLLLTGNTFDWRDGSLRAWTALEQGFELLGEHDIHVFVVPGETDPASAWLNGPRWPGNVTLLYAEDGEPVAAMRDDKPVATIRLLDAHGKERDGLKLPRGTAPASGPLRLAPFTIGVLPDNSSYVPATSMTHDADSPSSEDHGPTDDDLDDDHAENDFHSPMDEFAEADETIAETHAPQHPFHYDPRGESLDVIDYIALGGPPTRQTFVTEEGLAHHPGTTQGMNDRERGSCGVTLVELDRQGKGRSTFIPTGVVRWEHAAISLAVNASLDELQGAIGEKLRGIAATTTEIVCIIRWAVSASDRLERQVGSIEQLHELIERVALQTAHSGSLRFLHHAEWTTTGDDGAIVANATETTDEGCSNHLQKFLAGLADVAGQSTENGAAALKRLERELGHNATTRIVFQQMLDAERIHRQAKRLGKNWFQEMRGENDAA
ncbi:MAG: hypothetical protein WD065_14870 [Planctomycetaceae bacterium]